MELEKLGIIALKRGEYQEGINIYRRALQHAPRPSLYKGLGKAYYHLGDFPSASWAFRKTLLLHPGDVTSRKYLGLIDEASPPSPGSPGSGVPFRLQGDRIVRNDQGGKIFFIKGVNLGLGLPGYFPGDFSLRKGTYLRWFREMVRLGINTLRVYTLHPPSFYEALHQFNRDGNRLYLLQGIWFNPPKANLLNEGGYVETLRRRMGEAVDAVHGNAKIAKKRGRPHGEYRFDVSSHTIAYVPGREWGSCEVRAINGAGKAPSHFEGNHFSITAPSPFEAWLISLLEGIIDYEEDRYGVTRPVSTVNWPTLDPLSHPSESDYETELLRQGESVNKGACNENEDSATLDLAKVKSHGKGDFFPTYHVYPYYPDFMNNDPMPGDGRYRTYLESLKRYHLGQALLIGEFGVPSSRESAHWQKDGFHQGGHDEGSQGKLNGTLIRDIYDVGLAGGVLFSWFDEWFKRNWLFLEREVPPERNRLWFNHQDPEQNYGLIAAYPGYPGKEVTLSGNREEWKKGRVLYKKENKEPLFAFRDGYDEGRTLLRMRAHNDEGFFYLSLETAGEVDFTKSHYVIGLSTADPERGEFLVPFRTRFVSPWGLTFLIHLCGKEKSRILISASYDYYTNKDLGIIRPETSHDGAWILMLNRTNARRISKDGSRVYPPRVSTMSRLVCGSLKKGAGDYNSLADFHVSGNMIELRIPWGLIHFTDPSRRRILWREGKNSEKATEGIGITAISYAPLKGKILARETGKRDNITDRFPQGEEGAGLETYTWEGWEIPLFHLTRKESYSRYREALSSIPGGV